ncbi:PD-(D/E)XK nuclease family protein [Acidobacteriota bacterium]
MDTQTVKQIVKEELPKLVRSDKRIRKFVLDLSREVSLEKADKIETESRFDRILEELKQDREEQNKKWKENQEEIRELRDEQNRKWEENQEVIRKLLKKVEKHDTSLGALGSRWGIRAESSFRNALKGILEGNFDVKVLNINEYDDQGEVFGRPDQVELDIIIINSILIICEIKSSISKGDMYLFYKKAQFYEKRHNRTAKYLIAISPMVDEKAQKVARELGIKVYSYADEIPPDLLT